MNKEAVFVYSEDQMQYKFNDDHPFNHLRLRLTYDLLTALDVIQEDDILTPRMATDEEIKLFHDDAYIEAVQSAGKGTLSEGVAANYGIGTDDTPIFKNMHEASALLVGGTLTAVDAVMQNKTQHALHLGGGLHHGFRGRASGFCVYNDSAIAIEYMRRHYGARVLYIDTDAHHGDGVQWAFYDTPDVCTLSIHETGRYLFPGTGSVNEKGQGQGFGFSINIPVDAFTEDDSFLSCYETAIEEAAAFFKPDVILTQNGADAHYYDPLTHLSSTIKTFEMIPRLAHKLAHKYCGGKWVAVGGGGYDIWRVVPRAWSMLWLEMTNRQDILKHPIPTKWIEDWQKKSPHPLPDKWTDPVDMYEYIPRQAEITGKNEKTLEKSLYYIRNEQKTKKK